MTIYADTVGIRQFYGNYKMFCFMAILGCCIYALLINLPNGRLPGAKLETIFEPCMILTDMKGLINKSCRSGEDIEFDI